MDLMNATYRATRSSGLSVLLYAREKEHPEIRKRISISGWLPRFYEPAFPGESGAIQDIDDKWVKLKFTDFPWEVSKIRVGIIKEKGFVDQADIAYAWNYLLWHKVICSFELGMDENAIPAEPGNIPCRVLYLDIEVSSPPEIFPKPEDADYPIVTIQCWDSLTRKIKIFTYRVTILDPHQVNFDTERSMVLAFIEYLKEEIDPDVISPWNGILFDMPYLHNRCKKLGLEREWETISPVFKVRWIPKGIGERGADFTISGRDIIDLMVAYRKWKKAKGEPDTLDYKICTRKECGFEYEDYGDQIERLWIHDHNTLIEYCRNEALSFQYWHDKVRLIQELDKRRRITGGSIRNALENSKGIDSVALYLTDCPLPTKHPPDKKQEKFQGAMVIEPTPGMKRNVACYDLKSLYPTLIMYILPQLFPTKRAKLLAKVARVLSDGREVYRKERKRLHALGQDENDASMMEINYKFLACSEYGVTGYSGFRLFDLDYARTITKVGRELITYMVEQLERIGYKVCYGDTDSVWVILKTLQISEGLWLEQFINDRLFVKSKWYSATYPPTVKFEKLCDEMFFVPPRKKKVSGGAAKKRYVGHVIWDEGNIVDDVMIKGLEPKSSAASTFTRRVMTRFFELLMGVEIKDANGKVILKKERNEQAAIDFLKRSYNMVDKCPAYIVGIPRGTDFHKTYKTRNRWLEGCIYMTQNYSWRWRDDQKPKILYTLRIPGHPNADAVCTTDGRDLPKEIEIDWEKMKDRILKKKFKDILEGLGRSWSEIQQPKEQKKLETWF